MIESISPAFNFLTPSIILSGGNDIGTNKDRDFLELFLLDYAENKNIPTLGICRGMQLMAHWSGTKLKHVEGHIKKRHKLYGLISREVNSYHSMSLKNCPDNFDILANSKDGEIEAIKHKWLPWEGWMWHPEREKNFQDEDLHRIRKLFNL